MEELIDMHTHSNFSDGELDPNLLLYHAKMQDIGTIAITDHDTLEGIKTLKKEADYIKRMGLELYSGIELSAKRDFGRMHILGYGFNVDDKSLNSKMTELRDNSVNAVLAIYDQIRRDYGIRFTYEDIRNLINANHNLGRPDLAKLCIKYGFASSVQEAFDKYLIEAHQKTRQSNKGLQYEECLDLIINSGGIPVLAHPKSLELSNDEFIRLLESMISCGLRGIEVYHSSHTKEEMDYYLDIANRYNLLISGGSDFHGKGVKPDIKLGTGKNGNIRIRSLSLVDELRRKK